MNIDLPLDELRAQLNLALRDEKHQLAEALRAVFDNSEKLLTASEKYREHNETLLKDFEIIGESYQDIIAFIKDLHIILNGDLETAMKIKGMDKILPLIAQFVLSSGTIKSGVVRNA